jgi:hypothetical protein
VFLHKLTSMHIASFLHFVILSSVTCLVLPYFSTLYHKQRNFKKKGIERKICVLIFSTNFVRKFSLSEKNSAHIITSPCIGVRVRQVIRVRLYSKLEYSRQIFEKYPDVKFNENPFSGSRILPCRQTDMTKLIVLFSQFCENPQELFHNNC